jgi:hypothetical protein
MNETNNLSDENLNRAAEDTQTMDPTHEQEIEFQKKPRPSDSTKTEPITWLNRDEMEKLRSRWVSIQAQFVDQPRGSVEQAETLVADAVERIQQVLTEQQTRLSEQWCNHEDASTEDLRLTMQNYRTFLNRILDH